MAVEDASIPLSDWSDPAGGPLSYYKLQYDDYLRYVDHVIASLQNEDLTSAEDSNLRSVVTDQEDTDGALNTISRSHPAAVLGKLLRSCVGKPVNQTFLSLIVTSEVLYMFRRLRSLHLFMWKLSWASVFTPT